MREGSDRGRSRSSFLCHVDCPATDRYLSRVERLGRIYSYTALDCTEPILHYVIIVTTPRSEDRTRRAVLTFETLDVTTITRGSKERLVPEFGWEAKGL